MPLDVRALGYVVVGGAFGVLARALLLDPVTDPAVLPWATLGVNAAGSFALGLVVGALGDSRPHVRAFLGTGVLGGFTTYSAFAVETALWLSTPWLALGLAAASVAAGVTGAVAGLAIGRALGGRRRATPEAAE
ncbi:fluoride efflux transporter FluC [Microbacterium sp. NPDC057407]|uniref:fluoride efflux transporter FluC n=1 Tax=Microbacterium sp. NPDC057407 TaxID=3346120 RepID=UPI00366DC8F3